ncbi:molybdopterin oxidoreductase family protein [Hyphomicrobium sp. D-2]|uniref:molybdopterin-containing oxidoreductase family protein n=1 Tax=Hyphomicrobium sp. D-2 TaxID=3041621 RepID=UPI002455A1E8|nr:molybdopterin oxidoreductase family protein [Hyphomicrobium sp. D-2]MDH4982977.1 molybdopterin oxidoreductase family protein [Hyphomicrobium sp. D-2]
MDDQVKQETYFGACPHDCPDTCSMHYEVEDGKLVNVRGNKDHPITRGTLCVKLKDFHDHHANPERLMYPLRRVGSKGSGPNGGNNFERITWDEAISEIGQRWRAIIDEHGAEAIMPYSYLGNMGLVQGINSGDPFFNRLGSTVNEKTFCTSGSSSAWLLTIGPTGGVDPESFVHAKYIVIWACNTISTNLHHWPFVLEARKRGAKVVVIDAFRSRTAKGADWHICPRPGTDGALAMGIINSMIAQGLVDQEYVDNYTVGFPELKERAKEFTPEYVQAITGVKAADVMKFAREYATSQPAAIRIGVAIERSAGGAQASRAIYCLPALAGAWRHVGGGVLQLPLWEFPVDWAKAARPDWIKPGTRVVNNLRLGQALTGEMQLDPPIKSLFVFCTNPVSQAPETNKICAGLQREDLFTIVAEHFITDTAKYADIILPAAMAAEAEDMMWSWGHFYLTYNQKAVEPPGECKPTSDMWRLLAKEMEFDDPIFQMTDSELCEAYLLWDDPRMGGIDMEHFRTHGYFRVNVGTADNRVPHAAGNFPTPSGKVEMLLNDARNFVAPPFRAMYEGEQDGDLLDPLPGYVPNRRSPQTCPDLARQYPLNIISPKSHAFLNSCYANEPHKVRIQGEQYVLISPLDANARNIREGDPVRVANARGNFEGVARVTDDVNPGIVVATLGYWRSRNRSDGSVNSISSDAWSGIGRAPTYSDNLVEVTRVN